MLKSGVNLFEKRLFFRLGEMDVYRTDRVIHQKVTAFSRPINTRKPVPVQIQSHSYFRMVAALVLAAARML